VELKVKATNGKGIRTRLGNWGSRIVLGFRCEILEGRGLMDLSETQEPITTELDAMKIQQRKN
jgi:hypothetical protein